MFVAKIIIKIDNTHDNGEVNFRGYSIPLIVLIDYFILVLFNIIFRLCKRLLARDSVQK